MPMPYHHQTPAIYFRCLQSAVLVERKSCSNWTQFHRPIVTSSTVKGHCNFTAGELCRQSLGFSIRTTGKETVWSRKSERAPRKCYRTLTSSSLSIFITDCEIFCNKYFYIKNICSKSDTIFRILIFYKMHKIENYLLFYVKNNLKWNNKTNWLWEVLCREFWRRSKPIKGATRGLARRFGRIWTDCGRKDEVWTNNLFSIRLQSNKFSRNFAKAVHKIWPELVRTFHPDVHKAPNMYNVLPVPNPFIVPGGQFDLWAAIIWANLCRLYSIIYKVYFVTPFCI